MLWKLVFCIWTWPELLLARSILMVFLKSHCWHSLGLVIYISVVEVLSCAEVLNGCVLLKRLLRPSLEQDTMYWVFLFHLNFQISSGHDLLSVYGSCGPANDAGASTVWGFNARVRAKVLVLGKCLEIGCVLCGSFNEGNEEMNRHWAFWLPWLYAYSKHWKNSHVAVH